ncbi:MAG: hypothetical protein EPO16_04170 [Dehalococcoidia bacterium]|nr:MAG: hypothetical protein EPO16_04170 [Dehalococcoidia bacterium]
MNEIETLVSHAGGSVEATSLIAHALREDDVPGLRSTAGVELREARAESSVRKFLPGEISEDAMGSAPAPQAIRVMGLDARRARGSAAFSSSILSIAQRLFAVVTSRALQSSIVVTSAVLDVEVDPEEGVTTPVLRIGLDASFSQTTAFWDSLATDFDRWYDRLDPVGRDALMKGLGLRFTWN